MKYLLVALMLTSCAEMNAKSLVCVGWCSQQEFTKAESPVKPKDFLKEIQNGQQ